MLDAADDLAHFASDLNLGAEKLLGLRNCLAGEDHANLELQFCKIIVGNLCFRLDIDAPRLSRPLPSPALPLQQLPSSALPG